MGTGIKPLNPIGGIPKQDRPKGHYVYLHRRGSVGGAVFYVGKGSGLRAWALYDRVNRHWLAVARKHGVYVDILKDGMTKDQSLLLEIDTIKEIGIDNLTNVSTGGESGRAGIVAWNVKPVICSNGMKFESAYLAAEWIRETKNPKASSSLITGCCRGKYKTAHGFTWAYYGEELSEYVSAGDQRRRKVYCSNGMEFNSIKDASEWAGGHNAPINQCLSGVQKSAYGFTWAYRKEDLKEYKERLNSPKGVECGNGMVFKSISEAARWLNYNGYPTARPGGICETLKGRQHKSYGFTWRYCHEA